MNQTSKDLFAITGDGAAWSVMIGVGESYLPAFVLALSSSQMAAGLVATLPMLIGSLLQMASPYAVRWLGSYRRWVVLGAMIQAAMFVPLILAAWGGSNGLIWIFVVASVYWSMSLGTGPAWNCWIETIVPEDIRASFFARRTRITQVGLLVSFFLGGLVLYQAKTNHSLKGFAILFLIAAAARLVSAGFLAGQSEPVRPTTAPRRLPGLREWIVSLFRDIDVHVLFFLLVMQAAVWISGPYFTPFMFVHLKLNYVDYALLISAAMIAKIVALLYLGKIIERCGVRRVLWTSALMIVPLSAMWIVSGWFPYLILLQMLAGIAWGAYELSVFLLFFEAIPHNRRVSVLTLFNLANTLALSVGALIGATLMWHLGTETSTYYILFGLSGIMRIGALAFLLGLPVVVRRWRVMATRPIALRPATGALDRPILASIDDDPEITSEEPAERVFATE